MLYKSLTLGAGTALILSGFSVWASVERIDDRQVLSDLHQQGIYVPQEIKPMMLQTSDPRTEVPQALLDQPEPVKS